MASYPSISMKMLQKSKGLVVKVIRKSRSLLKIKKYIFQEIFPSGELHGHLDSPNYIESNTKGTLLVSGWLFSRNGKINSLILVKNNKPEEIIEYGISRPDVASSYPDVVAAGLSGFKRTLLLNTKYTGKVDIKIWAILEDGKVVCCFARQVEVKAPDTPKRDRVNFLLFLQTAATKALKAYQTGRLPLSPSLLIHYIRRHYTQIQGVQNIGIEYSSIIHPWQMQDPFQRWIQINLLTPKLMARMKEDAEILEKDGVKISIVVPVYNTPKRFLTEMIDSVRNQIYSNWELCLADDASSEPHIREILKQAIAEDSRIKVVFRLKNGHIVEATNSALEIATGEYVALLDHDDILPLDALLQIAECVSKHPEVDWIYTDEDKINDSGEHCDPQMKGSWSPEMAITHNYTHHLTIIRRTLIEQVGGMRKGFEGAQDLDLFLRVSEKTTSEKIQHIPHICYHWRTHAGSTASSGTQKQYVFDSAYRAIEDAIQRRGLRAKAFLPAIAQHHGLCLYQLKWDNSLLAENPVTIVIPTRDRVDLLEKCVSSLEKTVDKRFVKLIIIDDSSIEAVTQKYFNKLQQDNVLQCRVIHAKRKEDSFNYARLMNLGAEYVDTPYMLHFNNDIQATETGWLEEMVGWMSINGVEVVGAKLLYPNLTIQHGGVVVGSHGGLADHLFKDLHKDQVGYICLPHAARNLSAITGACLLTSTKLYREIGGFDEENFAVEYNDVDYCLRVLQSGKRIVYTPQAVLIHKTSASRGNKYNPKEHRNFLEKYKNFTDPFFNESLDIDSMLMSVNPYHFCHTDRIANLRVLFITHNLNLEGASLIVYRYARYFATEGKCEVYVISHSDGVLRQEYEKLDIAVKIIQQPLPIPGEGIDKFHRLLKKLGENLELRSFDLVVCNTLVTFWGVELARLFTLPSIWHIHESQSVSMSINSFFGAASEEAMQKLLPDCLSNATRVVFQAEATRKIFHQFDTQGHFRTIPGGLDLQKIKEYRSSHSKSELRDKYGINQNHIVISIIGTTCERKGQHILLEALKELKTICPDKFANITCLIVGARSSSYLDLLKRQIDDLKLKNVKIIFETKEVYDFYILSDIFVCASFEESFPRVLLEAMAFELKIVSTDVFGIPEIVNDGHHAYLVEPGNPKALANALWKCLKEPALSSQFAKNAYARFCRVFDNRTLIPKHLLLAREAVLVKH